MTEERCGTCRYFRRMEAGAGGWGDCRRFPPVQLMQVRGDNYNRTTCTEVTARHPTVSPGNWCGEYRQKEERAEG